MSCRYRDPVNGRDTVVERLLTRHAESFELARRLSEAGERFISTSEVYANDPVQVVPTCLLARLISGLRSLCLLAANGFYTEALGHQRSLMEGLARLSALTNKADLIHDFIAQDVLNKKKLMSDILEFRRDWGPEVPREPSDEELHERIRQAGSWLEAFNNEHGRKARDVKTFDWAEVGKVGHLLFGRFVIASEALHFSPQSLDHLMIMDGQKIKGFRLGPEGKDLDHLILSSCKYVFVGIQSLANLLSARVPGEVDDLYLRFEAIFLQKAEAALATTTRS